MSTAQPPAGTRAHADSTPQPPAETRAHADSTPQPPAERGLVAVRPFDDLAVGEEFPLPGRTVTEAHFAAFQAISGDNHPIHYDVEYCRSQGHDGMLAHGLQVLCYTAAGAGTFADVVGRAMIGYIDQSCRFLKPVYPGDTLYPTLRIAELKRQRTTGVVVLESEIDNQHGERVLEGRQSYLVRLSR